MRTSGQFSPQPMLTLGRPSGSRAQVSVHGGQVLSWIHRGREQLFTSPLAIFRPGRAIRGGIPVIFPQFGDYGSGLRHGFARLHEWQPIPGKSTKEKLALMLSHSEQSLRLWPHRFRAELEVQLLDEGLWTALTIANCDDSPFQFTAALHTYLMVSSLQETGVIGLQAQRYFDAATGRRSVQREKALHFQGEVDRIYSDTGGIDLIVQDGSRRLMVRSEGFTDTVTWNPGAELAANLEDLGRGNHLHFICIEAANVETPVELPSGAVWRGSQMLLSMDE